MDIDIGNDRPFFLIAGPCAIEGEDMALRIAWVSGANKGSKIINKAFLI